MGWSSILQILLHYMVARDTDQPMLLICWWLLIFIYILLILHIYLPRTQMILVLLEKGLVLEGFFPSKIEVSWVLGTYYTCLYMSPLFFWVFTSLPTPAVWCRESLKVSFCGFSFWCEPLIADVNWARSTRPQMVGGDNCSNQLQWMCLFWCPKWRSQEVTLYAQTNTVI